MPIDTDIVSSTHSYERWLAAQTSIVQKDLAEKHVRMRESPFVFLRGTFYRWTERWPAVCNDLVDAPRVIAVGDLHLENFGTWRDVEGRLIWGVNDVDEAAPLPYTNDLVRLAVSAVLAGRAHRLAVRPRAICDAILTGYASALACSGRPIVLAERRRWLRLVALNDLRDPKKFWLEMNGLPAVRRPIPIEARRALDTVMPNDNYSLRSRTAGVGSLGRPRFVGLQEWQGGFIAREVKALVPSAAMRGRSRQRPPGIDLLQKAVRANDPFWMVQGSWTVRRLAPDCSRIESDNLPKKRDERKLLRAMGWETANLHLASPRARSDIARHLRGRPARWLEEATARMVDATVRDWRDWVAHS